MEQPEPENLEELSISEQVKHGVQRNTAENQVQQIEAQKQQAIAQHKAQVWEAKKQEKAEVYPDFDEKMATTAQTFKLSPETTNELMSFIGNSKVGVDVAYYLAENPSEANSLEGLTASEKALKYMEWQMELKSPPTQPTKPITKAKAPISSSKGKAGGVSNMANQTGDDFLKSFRAKRAQG